MPLNFTVTPRSGIICDICDIPAGHMFSVLCVLPRWVNIGDGERVVGHDHLHMPLARVTLFGAALYAPMSDACSKTHANSSYILFGQLATILIGTRIVRALKYININDLLSVQIVSTAGSYIALLQSMTI